MDLDSVGSEQFALHMNKIKEVLDSASMGIWRVTLREGCKPVMFASDKMLEQLGLDVEGHCSEEDVYDTWRSRISPESADIVKQAVDKIKRGENEEFVYQWNHPKLGVRYVRGGGVGYKNADGSQVVEGYHQDVTERVKKQMRDSLVVNALANVYACVFYFDLDADWYTSYQNNLPWVSEYISQEGCLSKGLEIFADHLCHRSDRENVLKFVYLSTLDERLKYRNSISLQYRGNVVRWLMLTFIVSERSDDGKVRRIVATVEDISGQRSKEKEMIDQLKVNIDANRAKTMMLQNMTHEIRTPLNAMFGFSQLLCMPDGFVSEEQKSEYFNYIYNSFNMLSMLIDDVMDITDAEHGNYRIQKTRFEVNKVCRNALQMAETRLYDGVKMYFTTEVADDYTIESDDRRIQQLLVNILTNACKHTQKGEIRLHLSTTENPGHLTFSVTDTGEGIPENMRKDIFERYKKGNDSVQGSGIGLHICSTIAEKLDAVIKLDESYTDGARFLFIL